MYGILTAYRHVLHIETFLFVEADLTFVALILGTLLDFTLGSVVLFAARKEKNRSNLFFGLFAFSLGIWTLTIMGYRTAEQPQVLLFWMKAAYLSALFIGLSFLFRPHFSSRTAY